MLTVSKPISQTELFARMATELGPLLVQGSSQLPILEILETFTNGTLVSLLELFIVLFRFESSAVD